MRTRVRRRLLMLAPLIAAVGVGGWYAHWSLIEGRFSAVTAGRLYQSAAMAPETLADVVKERGIRAVVDLRLESEGDIQAEREALSGMGVRYVHLPSEQVPSPSTVDAFLEIAGRSENQPLLVHCEHGEGRSKLFAALYRIEFEGWTNDRARRGCRLLSWRGAFSPDSPKGRYLLDYRRRLPEPSSR